MRFAFFPGLLALALSAAAMDVPYTVHLRADGQDSADGRTPATAVRTLGRAQALIARDVPDHGRDVVVSVAEGNYTGQTVVWNYVSPGHTVTIKAAGARKPIFRGDPAVGGTWLLLQSTAGQPSHLHVVNIVIDTYDCAFSIEGDRESLGSFNSDNRITGCDLHRIGNKFTAKATGDTAAIRFVNSRRNVIEDCTFDRIENRPDTGPGLLHAIYFAHYSSDNRITNCTFGENSGDTLRVRDESNDNLIEQNTFLDGGGEHAAVSEWYCSKPMGDPCTKKSGIEHPTWGTLLRDNRIGTVSHEGKPLETYSIRPVTPQPPTPRDGGARYTEERTFRLTRGESDARLAKLRATAP